MDQPVFKPGQLVRLVNPRHPEQLNKVFTVLRYYIEDGDAYISFASPGSRSSLGDLYASRFVPASAIRRP